MKPNIIRFDPQSQPEIIPALVECYREVFSDVPWNEWKRCAVCGTYWGKKDLAHLQQMEFLHCGRLLVDFWEVEHVEEEIHHRITPEASCYIAIAPDGSTIGFTWGFPATFDYLEEDLKISIREKFQAQFGTAPVLVAYQNEIGVDVKYRGQKIAKNMYISRSEDFIAKELTYGVVRTRQFPEPSVTFSWFTEKLGYKIIARYPGDDGRVILAQRLEDAHRLALIDNV